MTISQTTVKREVSRKHLLQKMGAHFATGLITIVPIGITMLILAWLFTTVDNILEPLVNLIVGRRIPGVGFAATVILIYIVGVIASNLVGKRLIHYGESVLGRIPIIRTLYGSIRDIIHSLRDVSQTTFLQVVLVEFPKPGMRTVGFVTNETYDRNGQKLISVFIPTPPNPAAGFLELVREEDIIRTSVSINEALKLIVSVGKMTPQEIVDKMTSSTAQIPK